MMRQSIALLAFVSTVCSPLLSRGGETELGRFRSEYPKAAKALEATYSQAQGTCRITDWSPANSSKSGSVDAKFAAGHGFLKLSIDLSKVKVQNAPRELIYCASKESIFKLERMSETGPYTVAAAGNNEDELAEFDDRFGSFYVSPYSAFTIPFSEMMKSNLFSVTSAEYIDENQSRLIKVEYRNGEQPEDRGTVVFDPQLGWVIKHFELVPGVAKGEKFIYDIKYNPKSENFPFPTSVELRNSFRRSKCEFLTVNRVLLPAKEFSMEYYALPDLVRPAPQQRRSLLLRFLGIFGFTLGLAGLAVWVRHRRRA